MQVCELALGKGERIHVLDFAICTPKRWRDTAKLTGCLHFGPAG
jgi:hypothetical protein